MTNRTLEQVEEEFAEYQNLWAMEEAWAADMLELGEMTEYQKAKDKAAEYDMKLHELDHERSELQNGTDKEKG